MGKCSSHKQQAKKDDLITDLSRTNRANNSKELAHLHTERYVLQCWNIQTLWERGE